tara:strand:- start:108 stop:494 length:387 start_codon:yes stop_codon:yes gene_type:complete
MLVLSSTKRAELEEDFRSCVAYRSEDEYSPELYAAIHYYLQRGGDRVESDLVDVELFALEDALTLILDLVLDHSVDARIWAFSKISAKARKTLISTNNESAYSGEWAETDPLINTLVTIEEAWWLLTL